MSCSRFGTGRKSGWQFLRILGLSTRGAKIPGEAQRAHSRSEGGRPTLAHMDENVRLGRVAGIRISANWSLLAVFALVVWTLAAGQLPHAAPGHSGLAYLIVAVGISLTFYACLLAHELAHALVARRRGMQVEGIVLWLLGGVSRLNGEPSDPDAELRIAVAGPATSLALALAFFGLSRLAGTVPGANLLAGGLGWLGWTNGLLAVFNLTPAFPLDGGRVLRSLLWRHHGDKQRATATAAQAGRGFGYGFIGIGLAEFATGAAFNGVWLALIGWFLLSAGRAETAGRAEAAGGSLAGLRVTDAMTPDPLTVPPWLTLDRLLAEGVYRRRLSSFPMVDGSGSFAGMVTLAQIKGVPPDRLALATTGQIARPEALCLTCAPDDDLGDVARRMAGSPDRRAVVLDNGRVAGIVSPSDLGRTAAHIRGRLPARVDVRV